FEDDERKRQAAGKMSAIAHKPGLGEVTHFGWQNEVEDAGDENQTVGFAEAELSTLRHELLQTARGKSLQWHNHAKTEGEPCGVAVLKDAGERADVDATINDRKQRDAH